MGGGLAAIKAHKALKKSPSYSVSFAASVVPRA